MTQYLLSNITPTGGTIEPERLQRVIENVTDVTQQMRSAGVWVFAMGLSDPSSATITLRGSDCSLATTETRILHIDCAPDAKRLKPRPVARNVHTAEA